METLLPYLLDFELEIEQAKDVERTKIFWLKLAWDVLTCEEAAELFPEMVMCPVCFEREHEGVVKHKLFEDILN